MAKVLGGWFGRLVDFDVWLDEIVFEAALNNFILPLLTFPHANTYTIFGMYQIITIFVNDLLENEHLQVLTTCVRANLSYIGMSSLSNRFQVLVG